MSILHLKSNTIADATGTLTVFNTAGSTETAAATNLVRPSDWNSAHAIAWNLGGNTAGAAGAASSARFPLNRGPRNGQPARP